MKARPLSADGNPWPSWLMVVLGLVAAVAEIVLLGIDSGLERLQVLGSPSYGMSDLANLLGGSSLADAEAAIKTWSSYPTAGAPGYRAWGTWYVAIDTIVLVPAYLLVLRGLLLRARARAKAPPGGGSADKLLEVARPWWLFALLVAELVQNAAQLLLVHGGSHWTRTDDVAAIVAGAGGLTKWIVLAIVVVLVAMLWLARNTHVREEAPARRLTPTVKAKAVEKRRAWAPLRVSIVLVAAFGVLLVLPVSDQPPDVLRRWVDGGADNRLLALLGVALVLAFALAIWLSARRIALFEMGTLWPAPAPARVLLLAVVPACAAVLMKWSHLWALCAVVAGVAALSVLAGARWCSTETVPIVRSGSPSLIRKHARWLSSAVIAIFGLACVRAFTAPVFLISPSLLGGTWHWDLAGLIAGGLIAIAGAVGWHSVLAAQDRQAETPRTNEWRYWILFVSTVTLTIAVLVSKYALPRALSTVGIVCLFFTLLTLGATEIARFVERSVPMRVFRALLLTRTPAFVLIGVWFLLATPFDTGGFHNVRVHPVDPQVRATAEASTDIHAALQRWWKNASCLRSPAAGGNRRAVPLVFVAASGGGIRAAYWTASVLEHLTAGRCALPGGSPALYAASGISGGSLGLVTFTSPPADAAGPELDKKAYEEPLGTDHLAPTLAQMLFVDLPRSFVGFGAPDRAARLEQSWEESDHTLKKSFESLPAPPLLLLNGTTVEAGCRFSVAPVELGAEAALDTPPDCRAPDQYSAPSSTAAATVDLLDFMCEGQTVNRSTAALLSARFPIVSPAGRLTECEPEQHKAAVTHVVDGGYIDHTGGEAILDLWHAVEPDVVRLNRKEPKTCVVPIFLQLENSYQRIGSAQTTKRPPELTVPLSALLQVNADRQWAVTTRARMQFTQHYFRLAPTQRPGVEAPLGWVLSQTAKRDLDDQLSALEQGEDWSQLRAILTGRGKCRP